MILNMLSDIRENPGLILSRFGAEDKKNIYPIIKFMGNVFNKLTVGGVCRLLAVKCDGSIKKMLFKDYVCELVRGVFEGNQHFKEGTPKGDALLGAVKRLNFVLKKINVKTVDGETADLADIIKNSAGNYGIDDYTATLILE